MLWSATAAATERTAPAPDAPSADTAPTLTLPPVEVIAPTPLLGSGVERDKVPAETTTVDSSDISRGGNPDFLNALNALALESRLTTRPATRISRASLCGFQASPLQGNAQGPAVYVNGARFNSPFGGDPTGTSSPTSRSTG